MNTCTHKKTHMVVNPLEPHVGPSIEVCDECRMSRSHWEQGASSWLSVRLCDNCDQPTENTGDQAAGIILCDACKEDPRGRGA